MPYIGKSPNFGVRNRFVYLASASDTSVSGADANGATLTFTDGAYVDVYLNGVLLKSGTDYNTNTANTIAGISSMAANDEVTVVVYDIFTVADTVSAASGGTFSGGVTVGSTLDVTGNVSLDGGNFVFNESSADKDFRVESNDNANMLFVDGGNNRVGIGIGDPDQILELNDQTSGADVAIHFAGNGVDHTIGTDASNSGYLTIANSATVGTNPYLVFGASQRVNMAGNTSTAGRLNISFTHSTGMVGIDMIPDATTATMLQFKNSGGVVRGSITTGGSDTSYNETSDYRLKENVNYSWDATSKLKQLKPARFNWIDDETNTLIGGFLAHEVSSVVPEAVTGKKDETRDIGDVKDKDGNIIDKDVVETQAKKDEGQTWTKTGTENVYQQIDKSKLVPLLVKTIQELEARVTALESK